MATFDEVMQAAVNADKAGDTQAAQMLVDLARSQIEGTAPSEPPLVPMRTENEAPSGPPPDRFGDTIKDAVKAPLAATRAYGAGLLDQENSISLQNMPKWVPDPLKRPAATLADTAMTGLNAAGSLYALGAGTVGEVLGGSPTQEKKLARDLMMMGEVAVPELAGASAVARASSKAAKASQQLQQPATEVQEIARAGDDLGITPSLGAGGKVRGMSAATLEKVPFAGSAIAKDAARFVGEVEGAFETMRSRVGKPQGAAGAGEVLQGGLQKFVDAFETQSKTLYDEVGKAISANTMIQSPETLRAIEEALQPFADKPEIAKQLGLNRWQSIASDLETGLSWKAASDLRSSIGKSIGKMNGALADMDQGRLKQVYGTLTADLEQAAMQAGPKAEKAWKRASNFYRRGAERIQSSLDKTISADSPERAFEAFEAMTRDGRSTANSKRLYEIKKSMSQNDWNVVAASIVDRMGTPNAGQQSAMGGGFSPAKFLTDWNKMSPEAKAILLPPDVRKEMTKLAQVSQGSRRANAERNFSNTGQINAGIVASGSAAIDPVVTGAVLATAAISAKAFTNRRFLKALNRGARGDARQLRALANGNSPFAQEAATILRISAAEAAQGGNSANTNPQPISVGAQP